MIPSLSRFHGLLRIGSRRDRRSDRNFMKGERRGGLREEKVVRVVVYVNKSEE